jgi:hypothetical protein
MLTTGIYRQWSNLVREGECIGVFALRGRKAMPPQTHLLFTQIVYMLILILFAYKRI